MPEDVTAEAPKPLEVNTSEYWKALTDQFDSLFPDGLPEPQRAAWHFVSRLMRDAPYDDWRASALQRFCNIEKSLLDNLEFAMEARRAHPDPEPEDATPDEADVLRARLDRVTSAYNAAWNYYQAKDNWTRFERGAIEALEKIKVALFS